MKQVPEFKTDAEAEAFLEQDLSGLDFKQFKPMALEVAQWEAGSDRRVAGCSDNAGPVARRQRPR